MTFSEAVTEVVNRCMNADGTPRSGLYTDRFRRTGQFNSGFRLNADGFLIFGDNREDAVPCADDIMATDWIID